MFLYKFRLIVEQGFHHWAHGVKVLGTTDPCQSMFVVTFSVNGGSYIDVSGQKDVRLV